jgi:hypothetical protein
MSKISALFRVLSTAANGREATLLRLFADAVAIWHDIDLRGYVEDVDGNFRLVVALPGTVSGEAPLVVNAADIAVGQGLAHLSVHDLDTLGFRPSQRAMAIRVGDVAEGMAWLLVLSSDIESAGDARLALYTDVLRHALRNVASASFLAAERAIWQHLAGAADRIQAAAEQALAEVRRLVEADLAALSIALGRGGQVVRVGDVTLLTEPAGVRSDRLTATVRMDDEASLTLVVADSKQQFFRSRDRQIVENIGRLFASWARGLLGRPDAFDRRASPRAFEDVLEEAAARAAAHGTSVSVVVIKMKTAIDPAVTHELAARLRSQVRAGETVGVLDAGELGLLLHDVAPDLARAVGARLARSHADASVGVAYCPPGTTPATRLVHAARESARGPA